MTDAGTATAAIKKTAPNGLRIICEHIPAVRSVAVGVWCDAGVADEPPAHNGISHLLEHMLFKGTARRTGAEISAALDGVGGSLDGFTDSENVVVSAHVLNEHLPLALDVLADILLNSTFPPEELAREKNVVAEEIRLYEDSPDAKVHDLVMRALAPNDTRGLPVLGSLETVASLERDDVAAYHRAAFNAGRMVVAAAGFVEPAAFVAMSEEYFGPVAAAAPAVAKAGGPLPPFEAALEKDTEQTHLCVAYPGVSVGHEDRYVAACLTTLLGGNTSSRLFRRVREERGLAYAVYAYNRAFRDSGAVVCYAGTGPATALETRDLVIAQLKELATQAVGADELARTREYLKGTLMLALESTAARMARDARHEVYLGRFVPLEETLAGVEAVTAEDVGRLAAELFAGEPAIAAVGPNAAEIVGS